MIFKTSPKNTVGYHKTRLIPRKRGNEILPWICAGIYFASIHMVYCRQWLYRHTIGVDHFGAEKN